MPSFWKSWTSSNDHSKQDKSVLSDIHQGSQKVQRKLGSSNGQSRSLSSSKESPTVPSHTDAPAEIVNDDASPQEHNSPSHLDRVIPEPETAPLPPPPPIPESEPFDEPLGRKSTESRPQFGARKSTDRARHSRKSTDLSRTNSKPRRSGSMRRAYTYMFGSGQRENAKPENGSALLDPPATARSGQGTTSPTTEIFHEATEHPSAADQRPGSPPVEKLKEELVWYKKELQEAADIIQAQTENLEASQKQAAKLQAEYEEKHNTLQQQKKAIEDHMVSVVVQQVKEARESERKAVVAECQQDYSVQLEEMRSANMNESMAMIRDRDTARKELEKLKDLHAELEAKNSGESSSYGQRIGDLERGLTEKQAAHDEVSKQRADLHVQLSDALSSISRLEVEASENKASKAKINELWEQVDNLTAERSSLTKEFDATRIALEAQIAELTTSYEGSKVALQNAEAANEQLKAQMTELKEDLSKQLQVLSTERATLGEELATARAATESLTSVHASDRETAKAALAAAEDSHQQLKLQLSELEEGLKTADTTSKEQLDAFEAHKADSQKALAEAIQSSRVAADEATTLKTTLSEKEQALQAATLAHSTLETQLAEQAETHQKSLSAIEAELTTLKESHGELLSTSETKSAELASITAERDSHAQTLEETKLKLADLEAKSSDVDAITAERDSHKEAHETTRGELEALTSERDDHVKSHDSTKVKLTELTAALAAIQAEHKATKDSLESKEAHLVELTKERDDHANAHESTKTELLGITTERDNHIQAHDATKSQLEELHTTRATEQESLTSLKADLEAKISRLEEQEKKQSELETAIAESKTALAAKEEELEKALAESKSAFAAKEEELEKALAESKASLAAKEKELEKALASSTNAAAVAKDLEDEKAASATLNASVETANRDLESTKAELEESKAKIEHLSKAAAEFETLQSATLLKVEGLEKDTAALKSLEDQVSQLKQELDGSKANETSAKEANVVLQEELTSAKVSGERVSDLEKELEESKTSHSSLNEKHDTLEKELSAAKVSVERVLILEAELATSKQAADLVQDLEKELGEAKTSVSSLQEKHRGLEAALATAKSDSQASADGLAAKDTELNSLKVELESVSAKLLTAEEGTKTGEAALMQVKELETKNAELDATFKALQEKSTETEKSLKLAEEAALSTKEAEPKLRELEAKNVELVAVLSNAQEEASTHKKALDLAEENLKTARAAEEQLKIVETKASELETELAALKLKSETSEKAFSELEESHTSTRADLKSKILELENSQEHATQLKQALNDSKTNHTGIQEKLSILENEHATSWEQVGAELEKMKKREVELIAESDKHKAEKEALVIELKDLQEKQTSIKAEPKVSNGVIVPLINKSATKDTSPDEVQNTNEVEPSESTFEDIEPEISEKAAIEVPDTKALAEEDQPISALTDPVAEEEVSKPIAEADGIKEIPALSSATDTVEETAKPIGILPLTSTDEPTESTALSKTSIDDDTTSEALPSSETSGDKESASAEVDEPVKVLSDDITAKGTLETKVADDASPAEVPSEALPLTEAPKAKEATTLDEAEKTPDPVAAEDKTEDVLEIVVAPAELDKDKTNGVDAEDDTAKESSRIDAVEQEESAPAPALKDSVKSAMKVTVDTAKDVIGISGEKADDTVGSEKADSAVGSSEEKVDSGTVSPRPSPKKTVSFKDEIPGQSISDEEIPLKESVDLNDTTKVDLKETETESSKLAVVEEAVPEKEEVDETKAIDPPAASESTKDDAVTDEPGSKVDVPVANGGDADGDAEADEEEDSGTVTPVGNGKENEAPSTPSKANAKKNKKKSKGKKK